MPRPPPGATELLRGALAFRLRAPIEIGAALLSALRDPGAAIEGARGLIDGLRELWALDTNPASETPLNRRLGPHRRYDWLVFDLDEMNHVRKALGGTLNDLVLAIVAGAVGRFFERRGITEAEQRALDFRIACPMSLRPNSEYGTYGNQIAMLFVSLPIAERDPRRRIEGVREAMRRTKGSKQAEAMKMVTEIGESTAPEPVSLFARQSVQMRPSNMVVTNVPGPRHALYLLGAKMLDTYPVVPLMPEQAIAVALFSYSGRLHWGINSDWDLVPDLHDFVEALEESYAELRAAADTDVTATEHEE